MCSVSNNNGKSEKLPVAGRLVWSIREGAEGNRTAGIGIEFWDGDDTIPARIEN